MLSICLKRSGGNCFAWLNGSDFWGFKTPIYDEWVRDPEVRRLLQEASSGHGNLPDELRQVLLDHVYCGKLCGVLIDSSVNVLEGGGGKGL